MVRGSSMDKALSLDPECSPRAVENQAYHEQAVLAYAMAHVHTSMNAYNNYSANDLAGRSRY